jgi:hypothetical protein
MSYIEIPINTMIPLKYKKNDTIQKKVYDYIIVGGGPTGLTLAWILAKENKDVLLIEANKELGGCHRVDRVDGLFAEHGPRVYSDAFLNFSFLLEKMDLNFDDIFTKYNVDLSKIGNQTKYSFSTFEYISFIREFLNLSLFPNYSRNISMKKFMEKNNFSKNSMDYIERLCRLTDGATTEKYTLFQFLQLINQQSLYSLYQPKLPNDRGLIFLWQEALIKTNKVDFLIQYEVTKLFVDNLNLINSVEVQNIGMAKGFTVNCKNCILTIPPKPLVKLLNNSLRAKDAFGNISALNQWSHKNSYFHYIPITIHFKEKLNLPKMQGFPKSEWGLAFVILSNYMKFNDKVEQDYSNTVISTCITFTDRKSSYIGKTADECEMHEIYNEVYRQLKLSIKNLPIPYRMITSPQVKKDINSGTWINYDTAFVSTTKYNNIDSHSDLIKNLYSVGTHNGNSLYYFTSIESAVQNAIVFAHSIIPETKKKYEIVDTFHITTIINTILVILIFFISIYVLKKL